METSNRIKMPKQMNVKKMIVVMDDKSKRGQISHCVVEKETNGAEYYSSDKSL